MKSVYLAHPFRRDPERCASELQKLARRTVLCGELPVAPTLYLPEFIDVGTERGLAIACYRRQVSVCDEVRAQEAERLGIPVIYVEEG